jgi:hypothetical protein
VGWGSSPWHLINDNELFLGLLCNILILKLLLQQLNGIHDEEIAPDKFQDLNGQSYYRSVSLSWHITPDVAGFITIPRCMDIIKTAWPGKWVPIMVEVPFYSIGIIPMLSFRDHQLISIISLPIDDDEIFAEEWQ